MKILKYALLFLIVLVVAFFATGLFVSSVNYTNEVIINKPIAETWNVMSDESKLSQWIEGYVKSEHISGEKNSVGAVSKVYVLENGEESVMEETITSFKFNNHIGMVFTMDFMDMNYEMNFESLAANKTKVSSSSIVKGNGLFSKSLIAFMSSAMENQEDENLGNLKRLVESNSTKY